MQKKISTESFWGQKHRQFSKDISFDPYRPDFREFHFLLEKHLPKDSKAEVLEIGCFPGRYLYYFNKFYSYKLFGLDYLEESCR